MNTMQHFLNGSKRQLARFYDCEIAVKQSNLLAFDCRFGFEFFAPTLSVIHANHEAPEKFQTNVYVFQNKIKTMFVHPDCLDGHWKNETQIDLDRLIVENDTMAIAKFIALDYGRYTVAMHA